MAAKILIEGKPVIDALTGNKFGHLYLVFDDGYGRLCCITLDEVKSLIT